MTRLNEQDLLLLDTNKTISMQGAGYAYLGGNFTENPNDYVEVLIYDTNENFLESAVVDNTLYSINENNNKIKLQTGTILRSIGYDRGRYVVKYNFLRKIAGSYENVLISENGTIHSGSYHVMPNGTIMTGEEPGDYSTPLTLKEYKYFIHEISPSRKEIRLVPQNIDNDKYKEDFFDLQSEMKEVTGDGVIKFTDFEPEEAGNSTAIEYVNSNKYFSTDIVGGRIVMHDMFVQPLRTDPVVLGFMDDAAVIAVQASGPTGESGIPQDISGNLLNVNSTTVPYPHTPIGTGWSWYRFYFKFDNDNILTAQGIFADIPVGTPGAGIAPSNGWLWSSIPGENEVTLTYIGPTFVEDPNDYSIADYSTGTLSAHFENVIIAIDYNWGQNTVLDPTTVAVGPP